MSVPYVPGDDELTRQLEHLDALERREAERRLQGAEPERPQGVRPLAAQPRWPRGLPPPPPPGSSGTSLSAYTGWLEFACTLLEARVEGNEGELERLRSQWVHVLGNLDRLHLEEIDAVVESQARLREGIANDAALHEVLRGQLEQLAAWQQELASPLTDPSLVGRLLDEIAQERIHAAQSVTTSVIELLSTLLLDMEVVQRTVTRDPGAAMRQMAQLRERLSGAAARLRDQPAEAEAPLMLPGEPLQRALRRLGDRHSARMGVEVRWSGAEVHEGEVALATASILQECLLHLAGQQGADCEVAVEVVPGGLSMRVATPSEAFLPDGEPGWLVRARARAALAGGRLLCGRAGTGSVVEVRFQ